MNTLNEQLLKEATLKNICPEWADKITATKNMSALVQMYLDGIDFCLSEDFPSKEFLKANGRGELLRRFGVRIDETLTTTNPAKLVLLGNCLARVAIDSYAVSQVFVKHSSRAAIAVSAHAFVVVDAFDDAVVHICAGDNSKVLVNLYGKATSSNEAAGNAMIKVMNKHKNTY